ncbi:hypothetical protein BPAE_0034g00460 [Botrytis paeoniae]|uniref:Uncharacterized protein n=1 Tax=Botrytis paeoniae TaxID=278948 RepID=A0A4Z1FT99_9HELO|nr:hypothetical protein BPAE_0034g00460 [Botrytis paeoniae]
MNISFCPARTTAIGSNWSSIQTTQWAKPLVLDTSNIKIARYYEGKTDDEDDEEGEGNDNENQDKLEGIPEKPIETQETSDTPLSESEDGDPLSQEEDISKEKGNEDTYDLQEQPQSPESDKPLSTTGELTDSKLIESTANPEESLANDSTEADCVVDFETVPEPESNHSLENPSDPTPNTSDDVPPSVPDALLSEGIRDDRYALGKIESHQSHPSNHTVRFADDIASTSSRSRDKKNKRSSKDRNPPVPEVPSKPESLLSKKVKRSRESSRSTEDGLRVPPEVPDPPQRKHAELEKHSRGEKRKAKDRKEKGDAKKSRSKGRDASKMALVPILKLSETAIHDDESIPAKNNGDEAVQEPQTIPDVVQLVSDPDPPPLPEDNPSENIEAEGIAPVQENLPTQLEEHPDTEETPTSDVPSSDEVKEEEENVASMQNNQAVSEEHVATEEASTTDVPTAEDSQVGGGDIPSTEDNPAAIKESHVDEEVPVTNETIEVEDDKLIAANGMEINAEEPNSEVVSEAAVESPIDDEESPLPDENDSQDPEVAEKSSSSEDIPTGTEEISAPGEEALEPVESTPTTVTGEEVPSPLETPTTIDESQPEDDTHSSDDPAILEEITHNDEEVPPPVEDISGDNVESDSQAELDANEKPIEESSSEEPVSEEASDPSEPVSLPAQEPVTIESDVQNEEKEELNDVNHETLDTPEEVVPDQTGTEDSKDEPIQPTEAETPGPKEAGPESVETLEEADNHTDEESKPTEPSPQPSEDNPAETEPNNIDINILTPEDPTGTTETNELADHVEDPNVEDDVTQELAQSCDSDDSPAIENKVAGDSTEESPEISPDIESVEPNDDVLDIPATIEMPPQSQEDALVNPEALESDAKVEQLPIESENVQQTPVKDEASDESPSDDPQPIIEGDSTPETSVEEEASDKSHSDDSQAIIEEHSTPETSVAVEDMSTDTGESNESPENEETPMTFDQTSNEAESAPELPESEESPTEIEECQEPQANDDTVKQLENVAVPAVVQDDLEPENVSLGDVEDVHESSEDDEIADLFMPEQDLVVIEETSNHPENVPTEDALDKTEVIQESPETGPVPEADNETIPVNTENTLEQPSEESQVESGEEQLSNETQELPASNEQQIEIHQDPPQDPNEILAQTTPDNTNLEPIEEPRTEQPSTEHDDEIEVKELKESDPIESENEASSWDGDSNDEDSESDNENEDENSSVTEENGPETAGSEEKHLHETEEINAPVLTNESDEVPVTSLDNAPKSLDGEADVQLDETANIDSTNNPIPGEEPVEGIPESVEENNQPAVTATVGDSDTPVHKEESTEDPQVSVADNLSETVVEKDAIQPSEDIDIAEVHEPEEEVIENTEAPAVENLPELVSEGDKDIETSETDPSPEIKDPTQELGEDPETHVIEGDTPEAVIEEEGPVHSEEAIHNEEAEIAVPEDESDQSPDVPAVETSEPISEEPSIETTENVPFQEPESPVPEQGVIEAPEISDNEENEPEPVVEDKEPIQTVETVSNEDPNLPVHEEQPVEAYESPAALEDAMNDEITGDVAAKNETQTIDEPQPHADEDKEVIENVEAPVEPKSVPINAIPVETVADKEPSVEAPEEEEALGKDADPESTHMETVPIEEPLTEDLPTEEPAAEIPHTEESATDPIQENPAEPEPEPTPSEPISAPAEESAPSESPIEPEASKCPGGFEFISNWALDPLRRASLENNKLIDLSPAANDPPSERVVIEEIAPEPAPVDNFEEPVIESNPELESVKTESPIEPSPIIKTPQTSTKPIENLEDGEQAPPVPDAKFYAESEPTQLDIVESTEEIQGEEQPEVVETIKEDPAAQEVVVEQAEEAVAQELAREPATDQPPDNTTSEAPILDPSTVETAKEPVVPEPTIEAPTEEPVVESDQESVEASSEPDLQQPVEKASVTPPNEEPVALVAEQPIDETVVAEALPLEEPVIEGAAVEQTTETKEAPEEPVEDLSSDPPAAPAIEEVPGAKEILQEAIEESPAPSDPIQEQSESPKEDKPKEVEDFEAAAVAGLAGAAAGAAAAKALDDKENDNPIADQPLVNEPERIENREDKGAESPSKSDKSDKDRRRHRSSRHHSFSNHNSTKYGEYPPSSRPEEQPRRRRHSHSHRTSNATSDREEDKENYRSHRSSQKQDDRERPERSHRRRSSHREDEPERSYRRRSGRKEEKEDKEEPTRGISPAKQSPDRRDSAIEGVDDERERRRRHRRDRNREEQEEHDRKKEERRAAKREAAIKAEEAFRAEEARKAEEALQKKKSESIALSAAPKRSRSRRESVSKSYSVTPHESDGIRSRLLSLKKRVQSEVTSPFIANDEPHIKEKLTPVTRSRRDSIVDEPGPPQFDVTPERPKMSSNTRKSSRSYPHHSHSSSRRESERTHSSRKEPSRGDSTREKYKTEEEKEARRARREMKRQEKLAKEEAEAENRLQRGKDDELRRQHREERRRRREERDIEEREAKEREVRNREVEEKSDKSLEPFPENDVDNGESKPSSRPVTRERRPTRHHSNSYSSRGSRPEIPASRGSRTSEKPAEKPKSAFKSFMTLGKKVFASEKH